MSRAARRVKAPWARNKIAQGNALSSCVSNMSFADPRWVGVCFSALMEELRFSHDQSRESWLLERGIGSRGHQGVISPRLGRKDFRGNVIPGCRAKRALPWAILFSAFSALARRVARASIWIFFFAFSFVAIHHSLFKSPANRQRLLNYYRLSFLLKYSSRISQVPADILAA